MNDIIISEKYKETAIHFLIQTLLNVWKTNKLCQHKWEVVKKEMFLNGHLLGIYRENLELFGLLYFDKAIINYAIVMNNQNLYWYKYRWLFWDFIEKGYKKFSDEACPLTNFRINNSKTNINVGDSFLK